MCVCVVGVGEGGSVNWRTCRGERERERDNGVERGRRETRLRR